MRKSKQYKTYLYALGYGARPILAETFVQRGAHVRCRWDVS